MVNPDFVALAKAYGFQAPFFLEPGGHCGSQFLAFPGDARANIRKCLQVGDEALGLLAYFGNDGAEQNGAPDRGERILRRHEDCRRRISAHGLAKIGKWRRIRECNGRGKRLQPKGRPNVWLSCSRLSHSRHARAYEAG